MDHAILDSYQYIVGIYLLYVAIKGQGNMYRFEKVRSDKKVFVRKFLRGGYFFIALLCLLDGFTNSLMRSLFVIDYVDGIKTVTKVAELSWWKSVTFDSLNNIVTICIALILLTLISLLFVIRKYSHSE